MSGEEGNKEEREDVGWQVVMEEEWGVREEVWEVVKEVSPTQHLPNPYKLLPLSCKHNMSYH